MAQLSESDKGCLDALQPDKRLVLEDLLKVVAQKKEVCDRKKWRYTRANGQVVEVREVLDKVVDRVKQFRDIGDEAVQFDPVHAALPWAGVRLLLQVCCHACMYDDSHVYGR